MSYSGFSENYNNPFSNIAEGVVNAENSASGMMAKFRNNKMVSGTKEFLNSNSLVAKVCFLMLIIILFILGVRFGSRLLTWILSPSKNPILIDGLRDAQRATSVSQDPSIKGSIPILRSVNEREGIEFSWSVWLFIKDSTWSTRNDKKRHIFNKGSNDNNSERSEYRGLNLDGLHFPNNGPGLYLDGQTNELLIYMNTFDDIMEEVRIPDIPTNKWVNVVIRCRGRNMDTYMNGTVRNRYVFNSVPKQNYGKVHVTKNGGFSGNLSSLRYFDKALTGIEIQNLVDAGPNLKADDSMKIFPPYLSLKWFFKN